MKRNRTQRRLFQPERLESRCLLAGNLLITDAYLVDRGGNREETTIIGKQIVLAVEWTTEGLAASDKYAIEFAVDGVPVAGNVALTTVPHLEGAGSGTIQSWKTTTYAEPGFEQRWFAFPGTRTATVRLDPFGSVAEVNEADNEFSFQFSPTLPSTLPDKLMPPLLRDWHDRWRSSSLVDVDPRLGVVRDYKGMQEEFSYDGHSGWDMTLPSFSAMDDGVPVVASLAGTVTFVEDSKFDRGPGLPEGNLIQIDHGSGWDTGYGHIARDSAVVKVGDVVVAGQIIAFVGASDANVPHVHFRLRHKRLNFSTNILPSEFWSAPNPTYPMESEPKIQENAIIGEDEGLNQSEKAQAISVFPSNYVGRIGIWQHYAPVRAGDRFTYEWFRPDGTRHFEWLRTEATTYQNFRHKPRITANWSSFPGQWEIVVSLNGRFLNRMKFEISLSAKPAEIQLLSGEALIIDDRTTPIDFGSTPKAASAPTKTFTVENRGFGPLTLTDLELPPGFSVVGVFPNSVGAGTSATFTVQLDTDRSGPKFGDIRFRTNDPDERLFNFTVEGIVEGSLPVGSPVIDFKDPALGYNIGHPPALISPKAIVTDSDSATLVGGKLTVAYAAGGQLGDRLFFVDQGGCASQVGVNGSTVTYGGVAVGQLSGGQDGISLVVDLNANATPPVAQALVRSVAYSSNLPDPPLRRRDLRFTLTDGSGKESNQAITTVILGKTILNAWPAIEVPENLVVDVPGAIGPLSIKVADLESPATSLSVQATSSNPALLPNGGISLGGSGVNRTLTLNPNAGVFGSTEIRVSVIDQHRHTTSSCFVVIVQPSAGVTVTQTGTDTSVSEAGQRDQYSISLNTTPTGPVAVEIRADSQSEVSLDGVQFAATRTFSISDQSPRTVYVRAVDDANVEGAHTSTITHSIVGPVVDGKYSTQLSIASLSVNITDNDRHNPILNWSNPTPIVFGTPLSTTQLNATANVAGSFVYSPAAGTVLNASNNQLLSATFTPSDLQNYNPATITTTIDVLKAIPSINWSSPAAITYGMALSSSQLNATSPIPGQFTHTPPAGTVLSAGSGQQLRVDFTPDNSANYTEANASVLINVLPASPVITWASIASIAVGTLLTEKQLNATSSISGKFNYRPPTGTTLNAGHGQLLNVEFVPNDSQNYTSVTRTNQVNVIAPGIVVSETDGSTEVSEVGTTDKFHLSLADQPDSSVVITLTATDESEVALSHDRLTFTASNWNLPQEVIVSGVPDLPADGDIRSFVVIGVSGPDSDPLFASVADYSISVLTTDHPSSSLSIDSSAGSVTVFDEPSHVELARFSGSASSPAVVSTNDLAETIELNIPSGSSIPVELRTADGDDRIRILDRLFGMLDGGAGHDELEFVGNDQVINLIGANAGQLTNIEEIDIQGNGSNTLRLDYESARALLAKDDRLIVRSGENDQVAIGTGWKVHEPANVNGEWRHVLRQNGLTIELANSNIWHNPINTIDVNRDGFVAPIDALLIINYLNSNSASRLESPSSSAGAVFYLDTFADHFATPLDALLVINFLNNRGHGEGETTVGDSLPQSLPYDFANPKAYSTNVSRGPASSSEGGAIVLGARDANGVSKVNDERVQSWSIDTEPQSYPQQRESDEIPGSNLVDDLNIDLVNAVM